MRYCSYQERSEWEVLNKAKEYDLKEAEDEQLIAVLREENFINEMRFASSFVRGKVRVKKWGLFKIKQGLIAKRVEGQFISKALKEIDYELYLKNLKHLCKLKKKGLSSTQADKAKLYRFLLSKGYESDLIFKAMDGKD